MSRTQLAICNPGNLINAFSPSNIQPSIFKSRFQNMENHGVGQDFLVFISLVFLFLISLPVPTFSSHFHLHLLLNKMVKQHWRDEIVSSKLPDETTI